MLGEIAKKWQHFFEIQDGENRYLEFWYVYIYFEIFRLRFIITIIIIFIIGHCSFLTSIYLSSRNVIVSINVTYLLHHSGVPQSSVLGPLCFILYTSLLNSVIYDSSVEYHLYDDDSQLFNSFSAPDFL